MHSGLYVLFSSDAYAIVYSFFSKDLNLSNAVARTKQHEEVGKNIGVRPAGRAIREQAKIKKERKNDNNCHYSRFRAPLIDLNESKQQSSEYRPLEGSRLYAIVAHAPLISRPGTLPHDLPFRFCIYLLQLHQYGCSPRPRPHGYINQKKKKRTPTMLDVCRAEEPR